MSNAPRTRPSRARKPATLPAPGVIAHGDQDDGIELWDEYVQDAQPNVEPWRKRMPDGEVLEIACPSSLQIDALGIAQQKGDVAGMMVAVFGEHAEQLVELTATQPFTVRVKVINDVMFHYGMSLATLPESAASSR